MQTKIKLKPREADTLPVAGTDGLKYAVVYRDSEVITLFHSQYSAEKLCSIYNPSDVTIREVAE